MKAAPNPIDLDTTKLKSQLLSSGSERIPMVANVKRLNRIMILKVDLAVFMVKYYILVIVYVTPLFLDSTSHFPDPFCARRVAAVLADDMGPQVSASNSTGLL